MFNSLRLSIIVFGVSVIVMSCDPKVKTSIKKRDGFITTKTIIEKTNCDCDSLWSKPKTKAFVEALEASTSKEFQIWPEYGIKDGKYILNAGKNSDSLYCLGLWKSGKNIEKICSEDVPSMLTPLYSYYLNYDDVNRMDSIFFQTASMSPDFTNWMVKHDIESAIYMPTEFPDFPFEIPAKTKAQLAVHESFHTETMLKYWYTGKSQWPAWDKQPDRSKISLCYSNSKTVEKLIAKELEALSNMLEALLNDEKQNAIKYGSQFLTTRTLRYSNLNDVEIDLNTGSMGSCEKAEAIMEIEEGLADYGSWSVMYEMGIFTQEELLKRYRAQQKERFYSTGSMLMHTMHLMSGDVTRIVNAIVESESVETGNLTTLFKEEFEVYKSN